MAIEEFNFLKIKNFVGNLLIWYCYRVIHTTNNLYFFLKSRWIAFQLWGKVLYKRQLLAKFFLTVVMYLKKKKGYIARPIYLQNRCYSGRPATLPVLGKMGISHSIPNSPSWPHMCTARFLSLAECHGESQCKFAWDGSTLQLQFTPLPLVIARIEAMFSTSLWRNQLSVLALLFPPPLVGLHKSTGF